MPQHRQVPTLQSVCLRKVRFTVERMTHKAATNVHVDEYVQQARDYINNLITCVPQYLYEHIAIEVWRGVIHLILKKSPNHIRNMKIVDRINENVAIRHLKNWYIFVCPKEVPRNFYPNMQNLTGLEKLEITYLHKINTDEFCSYIYESIPAMKQLKSLTFRYSCNDAIVQAIGNHCRDIEYLEIKGSQSVSDRSIPHLLKCSNLKILKISSTGISYNGMTEIIIGLPGLLEVDYNVSNLVFKRLKNLGYGPFGLRKAVSCGALSEDLHFFLNMFPKMEHIEFGGPIYDLPMLAPLVNLKTLIMRYIRIYGDYLKQLLKVKGGNITSVFLDSVSVVDIQDIIDIGLYCQNLECLGLINCKFTNNVRPSGKFVGPLFKNLRKVYCLGNGGMGVLEFVLSHASNIQVINVRCRQGIPLDITHSFVENVLSANPMSSLEEFSVSDSTDFSMRTVEILLESCANLKVLYCLERWLEIRKEELYAFKKYIASHNFNLQYLCSPHTKECVF